ncbi:MAG: class I SAM-dependent methyltransferase [Patescibacteria group bacterium]|mgnify:CR=1 FL=1
MHKKQNITKKYYEKNALRWAEVKTNSFVHEKQFKEFIKYLPNEGNVLDIGCAYGIHIPLFLGIGRKLKYEGMDITQAMLKLARSRYPQLSFQYGDIADSKTLPHKKYDGFWAASVLMHVPLELWSDMFGNLESITKKGGIGYFNVPLIHPNLSPEEDVRHFTILSKKKIQELLAERGWNILKSGMMDGFSKKNTWIWFIVRLPK